MDVFADKWTREKLEALVDEKAKQYGVPIPVARSLVQQESAWKVNASSGKAHGIMQLAPRTATELGVTDILDPVQNVDAGMRYLRKQYDRFGSTELALAAYNAGPGAVKKYGGIPPYKETQGYVSKIMKAIANFVWPTAEAADGPVYAKDKDDNRWSK
jgi:soluble lytic murein transglycosylase-like protein